MFSSKKKKSLTFGECVIIHGQVTMIGYGINPSTCSSVMLIRIVDSNGENFDFFVDSLFGKTHYEGIRSLVLTTMDHSISFMTQKEELDIENQRKNWRILEAYNTRDSTLPTLQIPPRIKVKPGLLDFDQKKSSRKKSVEEENEEEEESKGEIIESQRKINETESKKEESEETPKIVLGNSPDPDEEKEFEEFGSENKDLEFM